VLLVPSVVRCWMTGRACGPLKNYAIYPNGLFWNNGKKENQEGIWLSHESVTWKMAKVSVNLASRDDGVWQAMRRPGSYVGDPVPDEGLRMNMVSLAADIRMLTSVMTDFMESVRQRPMTPGCSVGDAVGEALTYVSL